MALLSRYLSSRYFTAALAQNHIWYVSLSLCSIPSVFVTGRLEFKSLMTLLVTVPL